MTCSPGARTVFSRPMRISRSPPLRSTRRSVGDPSISAESTSNPARRRFPCVSVKSVGMVRISPRLMSFPSETKRIDSVTTSEASLRISAAASNRRMRSSAGAANGNATVTATIARRNESLLMIITPYGSVVDGRRSGTVRVLLFRAFSSPRGSCSTRRRRGPAGGRASSGAPRALSGCLRFPRSPSRALRKTRHRRPARGSGPDASIR